MSDLHMMRSGPDAGVPLLLLHGFGGSGAAWDAVIAALPDTVPTITVDLPGHGGSLEAEGRGGAGRMAKAILAGCDQAGITDFHLAGHSMGGAVAALIAMRAGGRVKSLTLVAPGGISEHINATLLARYAEAATATEIRACLEEMSAPGFVASPQEIDRLVADRSRPGALAALEETYQAMFPDGPAKGQGVLPGDALAALAMPVRMIWGDADMVLPCPQPEMLPENFDFDVLEGMGHMLPEEAPHMLARTLAAAVKHGG